MNQNEMENYLTKNNRQLPTKEISGKNYKFNSNYDITNKNIQKSKQDPLKKQSFYCIIDFE